MKVCTKCGVEKEENCFAKEYRKGDRSSRISQCRQCKNAYHQQRNKRPEVKLSIQAALKRYRSKRDKILKIKERNSTERVREMFRKYTRKYREKLPEDKKLDIANKAKVYWSIPHNKVRERETRLSRYHKPNSKARDTQLLRHKFECKELTDYYVGSRIRSIAGGGIKLSEIPRELIEAKRLSILIQRSLKKIKNGNS